MCYCVGIFTYSYEIWHSVMKVFYTKLKLWPRPMFEEIRSSHSTSKVILDKRRQSSFYHRWNGTCSVFLPSPAMYTCKCPCISSSVHLTPISSINQWKTNLQSSLFNISPSIAIQTPSVSDDDTQRFTGLFGRASTQMLIGDQTLGFHSDQHSTGSILIVPKFHFEPQ